MGVFHMGISSPILKRNTLFLLLCLSSDFKSKLPVHQKGIFLDGMLWTSDCICWVWIILKQWRIVCQSKFRFSINIHKKRAEWKVLSKERKKERKKETELLKKKKKTIRYHEQSLPLRLISSIQWRPLPLGLRSELLGESSTHWIIEKLLWWHDGGTCWKFVH